ncbi:MAG: hypothetical protein BMS9Abin36_2071 [Gammaproteobacteria bacterium]|nr:MAG: hypothetical protein BMS9Abin36_2071 [Gammaproteobacteria bacterium]
MNHTKERSFGFILAVIAAGIASVPLLLPDGNIRLPWIIAAACIAVIAALIPVVIRPFLKLWLWIGNWLSFINTRIILGAVYWIMVWPIGMVLRIFGHNPLHLGGIGKSDSYWIERKEVWSGDSFKRQF